MSNPSHPSLPVDQAERDRIETELDRTFFVEAGAGTGKTTALVARIVALVRSGKVELDKLAAITFTEAAAAELRDRVRRGLERASRDSALDPEARERCRDAAGKVDLAAIQTIHAFAGTLLRAFPIEAGLAPGFAVWDDLQLRLAFEERFRTWLDEDVSDERPENRRRRDDVRRALRLGMTFGQLRGLADGLQEHADLLDPPSGWCVADPPAPVPLAHRLGEAVLELASYLDRARNGDLNELARDVRRVQPAARRLAEARDEDDALAALQEFRRPGLNVGSMAEWEDLPDGRNPVRVIRATSKAVQEEIDAALAEHRAAAFAAVLGHLAGFVRDFARARRQQGVAAFHDLLIWARDLLRDHPDVRAQARERFQRIFVDEFQDTDPLQAEIVWYLGADPSASPDGDPLGARLVPGKLFVVGDPKQSIYRFRRADIGLYARIYQRTESASRARLSQNFRSLAPVLEWVNYHFRRDMRERLGIQAEYVDLHPVSTATELAEHAHGVYAVGGKLEGKAEAAHLAEAEHVAMIARRAVADGWIVRDPADGRPRLARYQDVCVLMPSRTNVGRLEDAFAGRGVPYRLESGSLVLATQEVRDLLSCLRAIDDPSDQVALVAALRSPAYACSDVDLLAWIEAGGKLDYEQSPADLDGPVAEAFDSLRRFHRARSGRSAAATIEAFIRERMLAVQVFAQPRPREAWRRLRYVAAQARAFAAAGRPSLRALVDWLEDRERVQTRDSESPLPESDEDAVRLLTIHGAKGLEFPIVILTGLGEIRRGTPAAVRIFPDRAKGTLEVGCGAFKTPGFDEAQENEKLMDEAEQVRLLYVAATRARDHLVLSLFHVKDGCHAARISRALAEYDADRYHLIETLSASPTDAEDEWGVADGANADAARDASPEEHRRAEREWLDRRQRRIDELANLSIVAASSLDGGNAPKGESAASLASVQSPGESAFPTWLSDEGAAREVGEDDGSDAVDDDDIFTVDPGDPISGPSEPTALGRAVHLALEQLTSTEDSALDVLARRAAKRHRIANRAEEVKQLVLAAAASPVTREAWRAARSWREVPVGAQVDGALLLGRIDLLYEKADGSLGIVDFKTDRIDRETVAGRAAEYRAQGGAYALGIERATDRRVSSVAFVFAALDGQAEVYTDVDDLIAEARASIRLAGSPSGAGSSP